MLRAEGNGSKRDTTWGHLMEVGASWLTIQALNHLQENKSNPCLVSAPRKEYSKTVSGGGSRT